MIVGLYNVVAPCVVNDLHYVRPHAEPIEVDDDTAAELVESGCLTPYPAQSATADALVELVNADLVTQDEVKPAPPARGRRRTED